MNITTSEETNGWEPPKTIYVHTYMLPHFVESTLVGVDYSYMIRQVTTHTHTYLYVPWGVSYNNPISSSSILIRVSSRIDCLLTYGLWLSQAVQTLPCRVMPVTLDSELKEGLEVKCKLMLY